MKRGNKKPNAAETLLKEDQPLDMDEQLAVIAAIEEQHLQQHRTFKLTFAALALLIGAFFCYASYQQWRHPWEAKYTGELRPVTQQSTVVAVLAMQGTAVLAACCALLKELPKKGDRERACMPAGVQVQVLLVASIVLAAAGCIYWSQALSSSVAKFGYEIGAKWELIWLPLLPLGYCMICQYVVSSINTTAFDVQQLRRMTYDFKKV